MFVGHTRFSLYSPSSNGWVASRHGRFSSAEEYRDYLFSEERLSPRVEIFLQMTVPMLDLAAKDHDVVHVVSYSSSLPSIYKKKLKEASESSRVLELDEVQDGDRPRNVARVARDWMQAHGQDPTTPFGSMRLDDDDILSVDYFDQMVPYIIPEHVGYVVSLAKGITALYQDGVFHFAREVSVPLHSKGHLAVCAWDASGELRAPISTDHIHADRRNPVILDSRKISHLWTRTTTQDGSLLQVDALTETYKELEQYPAAAIGGIEEAFPLLGGRVTIGRHSV